jgi:hypothetical protein
MYLEEMWRQMWNFPPCRVYRFPQNKDWLPRESSIALDIDDVNSPSDSEEVVLGIGSAESRLHQLQDTIVAANGSPWWWRLLDGGWGLSIIQQYLSYTYVVKSTEEAEGCWV